jgi:hypothetical protein
VATKLTFCGPSYSTILLGFTVGIVTAGFVVPGGSVGTGIFDNGPPNRTNPFIFLFFVVCIHEKHFVRCGNFKTMSVVVGAWWQIEEPGGGGGSERARQKCVSDRGSRQMTGASDKRKGLSWTGGAIGLRFPRHPPNPNKPPTTTKYPKTYRFPVFSSADLTVKHCWRSTVP